ncbi:MAG: heme transporter ATP-binding protein [Jatrophihabitantaceae bacterium]|nr:heme transporter ATP-binding protein [Jatrophihabitantaceae bacterium]
MGGVGNLLFGGGALLRAAYGRIRWAERLGWTLPLSLIHVSATVVAKGLSAAFGTRILFADLDLVVAPGDVIGLVGANGAGKSTLLRMLAGLDEPESGTVRRTPDAATIGYLAQQPERLAGETLVQFLARRTGVAEATQAMDTAAEQLGADVDGAADTYSDALERWLDLGGADFEERAAAVAADLGLAVGLDEEMTGLSGGQAARAGLAALLLSRYDVLLLDEPTNDLDLDGLARLEQFVSNLRSGAVIVSHDREFLARTVTSVLELDLAQQQITLFGGGYDSYLEEKDVQRRHAREAYDQYSDRLDSLAERGRTQRAWMEKGVRNARRKAPDNDKIARNARGETSEKQAAKAAQTDRMIERLEEVAEPRKEWQLQMELVPATRSGSVVASLSGAAVSLGEFTLGPVTLQVDWADRVAITGPNGAGKTTLLRLLLGRTSPSAGRASLGTGVVIGEVDQARNLFGSESAGGASASVVDAFGRLMPEMAPADTRTLLAKFGLRADHVNRPATSLSPGERTRAALALLQARGVNLLVLDEPTNHLDLAAIEQLESALASYTGTLLLVTHDRRMLEAVSTTRQWEVDAGTVREA